MRGSFTRVSSPQPSLFVLGASLC